MFGMVHTKKRTRFGAIVDIGSGQVSVGIVSSKTGAKTPEIIWSHIERATSSEAKRSGIESALLNALLTLGSEGLKALRKHTTHATIETLLASISAPAAHTVSKTVTYEKPEPFTVTKRLLRKLEEDATRQATEIVNNDELTRTLNLHPITNTVVSTRGNGYEIHDIRGKEVHSLELTHVTCLANKKLVDALLDAKNKVLPGAELHIQSYMNGFYQAILSLQPRNKSFTLMHVSAQATEIALVENGDLLTTSHATAGERAITDKIESVCKVTSSESDGFMKENGIDLKKQCTETQWKDIESAIGEYEATIGQLYQKLMIGHSTPTAIYMHTNPSHESFFQARITKATAAQDSSIQIFPVTGTFFADTMSQNTDIELSAYVFHKGLYPQEAFED